jgi:hypothetical protein
MADKLKTISWDKIFNKNVAVVSRKIGGELFLVPIKGSLANMQRIFTLNPVAEYIWQELDKKDLNEICNGIVSRFEVGREEAERDISEFMNELLEANLITSP